MPSPLIYSNVPVMNNGVQTGTVQAVTLVDANGNYIINPQTGSPYLAPVGYSVAELLAL
jgi:hypothetical protein